MRVALDASFHGIFHDYRPVGVAGFNAGAIDWVYPIQATEAKEYYSQEPVAVSQSSTISGMWEMAPRRCEQRGSVCKTVAPYSFEMMRRSNSTTALRLSLLHAKRLRARRMRKEAMGTVTWWS